MAAFDITATGERLDVLEACPNPPEKSRSSGNCWLSGRF